MLAEQIEFLRTAVVPVPPLPPTERRPFWSVVIPTYGRPTHLAQALACVLGQDPGEHEMTIDVVDDATPGDEVRALVGEAGRGRVRYHHQTANLGTYGNVNDALTRAEGRWIHVLNDDDYVAPDFYGTLRASLPDDERVGAALTPITVLVERSNRQQQWPVHRADPGILNDWLGTVATQGVHTPAVVVRREAYETLGGYHLGHSWCSDWEMWQRIASHYDWWYEPGTRAFYREHAASFTGSAKRTGRNIADMGRAIAFAQNFLPPARKAELKLRSTRFAAQVAWNGARELLLSGDAEGACMQLSEMLRLHPCRETLLAVTTMKQRMDEQQREAAARAYVTAPAQSAPPVLAG